MAYTVTREEFVDIDDLEALTTRTFTPEERTQAIAMLHQFSLEAEGIMRRHMLCNVIDEVCTPLIGEHATIVETRERPVVAVLSMAPSAATAIHSGVIKVAGTGLTVQGEVTEADFVTVSYRAEAPDAAIGSVAAIVMSRVLRRMTRDREDFIGVDGSVEEGYSVTLAPEGFTDQELEILKIFRRITIR